MNIRILILVLLITMTLCQREDTADLHSKRDNGKKSYNNESHHKFNAKCLLKIGGLVAGLVLFCALIRKCKRRRQMKKEKKRQAILLRQNTGTAMGYPMQIQQIAGQPAGAQPAFYAVPIEQYEQFQKWMVIQQQQQQQQFQQQQQQQPQVQQGQPYFGQYGQPQVGMYPQFQNQLEVQQPNIRVQ